MSDILMAVRLPDPSSLNFLAGGGEMGALIRAYDWPSAGELLIKKGC